MVTVWWSAAGVIHHNFIKPDKTITVEKYCREINEMHQKLPCKQLTLVNRKDPIILYDNTRRHVLIITHQKLHKLNNEVLDHPPYSSDHLTKIFTFSNILITSCKRNVSEIQSMLKWHSMNLLPPEDCILWYRHKKKPYFMLTKVYWS